MPRPTISVDIQARDRTRQTIANFQGQIAGLTRTFGGLTRIVGPLAGAAGIGGIATAATQAVSAVAELNLQAERLDISVSILRDLQDVTFVRTGQDAMLLNDALSDMNERVGEAQEGWNTWTEQLLRYNVITDQAEARTLNTETAFRRILETARDLDQSRRIFFLEDVAPNLSRVITSAEAAQEALDALGREGDVELEILARDAAAATMEFRSWGRIIQNEVNEFLIESGRQLGIIRRELDLPAVRLDTTQVQQQLELAVATIIEAENELANLSEDALPRTVRGLERTIRDAGTRIAELTARQIELNNAAYTSDRNIAQEKERQAEALGISVDLLDDYNRIRGEVLAKVREEQQEQEALRAVIAQLRAEDEEGNRAAIESLTMRLNVKKEVTSETEKEVETAGDLAASALANLRAEENKRESIQEQLNILLFTNQISQEHFEILSMQVGVWEDINDAAGDTAQSIQEQVDAARQQLEGQMANNEAIREYINSLQDISPELRDALLDAFQIPPDARELLKFQLEDTVSSGINEGFNDALESGDINDFFDAIGRQLLETLNANIIQGILSGFGGGGGGGLLGALGGLFGGGRQQGGPVRSGQFYVVGEEGPELLVPGSAGQVIPNGGAGNVVVNQTNNISGVRETEQIYNFIELSNEKLRADLYADARNGRLPR